VRIAVFTPRQESYQTLRWALSSRPRAGPPIPLHPGSGWQEILLLLREGGCDVVVVDPDPGPHSSMPSPSVLELEQLRVAAGHGKVVLYTHSVPKGTGSPGPGGREGFPYRLDGNGEDDVVSVRRALATAAVRRAMWEEAVSWEELVGTERFLRLVDLLAPWPRPKGVACVAKRACASDRSVRRRLRELGLPPPRELVGWGVLMEAHFLANLVDLSHRELALHLGYEGGSRSLHSLSERLAGLPLEPVLESGAYPRVAASLQARLAGT
jgi:hypothetical protein